MKAAFLTSKGLEIREAPMPACEAGHVVVKTLSCGICGSELHRYHAYTENANSVGSDAIMGHEGCGVIEETAPDVRGLTKGDHVVAIKGAFAEYFTAPVGDVVRIEQEAGADLQWRWAAAEPIACCVHAAGRFGIMPGDRVAILGCGFMGLVCLQLAGLQGAGFLCAMDMALWRLDIARELGADATMNPASDDLSGISKADGDYDVVIEAAGTQGALDLAGDLVKQHGRIILVGFHNSHDGLRTVNMKQWNFKAIDVANGHVRRNNEKQEALKETVALLAAGKVRVEQIVTAYPIDTIREAFEDTINRKEGLLKGVIVP